MKKFSSTLTVILIVLGLLGLGYFAVRSVGHIMRGESVVK